MLTPHSLDFPIPLLGLLHDPDRLALRPQDRSPTLEDPLIQIRRPLERVVSASDDGSPVEAQHVAGTHVRHLERETHRVALGYEVGARVDMCGDVV